MKLNVGECWFTPSLRERPQTVSMVMGEEGKEEGEGGTLLGLPELDTEVDVSERGRKRGS